MTNATTTTRPARNAARDAWVDHYRTTYRYDVDAHDGDVTRAMMIDAASWFDGDPAATMPTWFDADNVNVPNAPTGVVVRPDIDAADVIGNHRPRYIDPADMTVVDGAWGRNAALDVTDPTRGVGRGYARPFIRSVDANANNHGDNGDGTMTCRSGDACVHDDGPTMSVRRFPTLSTPTADGRTRADRCRACRDAR